MPFGERLKRLREQHGWTQEELARQLQVTRDAVAGYESRGKIPRADKLITLARLLDTSLDYLFGLTDDPTPKHVRSETKSCTIVEEVSMMKRNTEQDLDTDSRVERLAAHLEGEYGEYDPEMAKFLHGVITEVLQDYQEFKRKQLQKRNPDSAR